MAFFGHEKLCLFTSLKPKCETGGRDPRNKGLGLPQRAAGSHSHTRSSEGRSSWHSCEQTRPHPTHCIELHRCASESLCEPAGSEHVKQL